ncbi:MAG TPA: amidohydrolase, partial [Candidatus Acidoferrum sp.]|nr:amidohydrolase [Candidatus Acidoferrum sp.]
MAIDLRDDLLKIESTTEQALIKDRRHLHQRPELSFNEEHTADYIASFLDRLPVQNLKMGVGGHGVVADVQGKRPGRSVLVRADMDGLPLTEDVDVPYRSTNPGVMHACGHDVHMAIALALADNLAVNQDRLPGLVRFAFQPAEEKAGGAKPMIEAGVLDGIDRVIGLHVWSQLPVGQICVRPGPIMAS